MDFEYGMTQHIQEIIEYKYKDSPIQQVESDQSAAEEDTQPWIREPCPDMWNNPDLEGQMTKQG